MNKLEIAKKIITENIKDARCGIFDTRNTVSDPMLNIYKGEGITIDICYCYEYFEVFGLNKVDFNELKKFYEELISSGYDEAEVDDE